MWSKVNGGKSMVQTIHDKALETAKRFKKSEIELISLIQEIDTRKAFYEKNCTSTFDYCVNFLNLSDNLSLDFIAVARKSKEIPELKLAIQDELITVSKARRITPVISLTWPKTFQKKNSKKKLQR
jgi:hypothetical protein